MKHDETIVFPLQRMLLYGILFLILFFRIFAGGVGFIIDGLWNDTNVPSGMEWVKDWDFINLVLTLGSYMLITISFVLNNRDLRSFNIDIFSYLVIITCLVIVFWIFFWPIGWLTGLLAIFMFFLLLKKKLFFAHTVPIGWALIIIFSIVFSVGLLVTYDFHDVLGVLKGQEIRTIFFRMTPLIVWEEVVFRGMLWMFLKSRNVSEPKIIVIQAFLFWISHIEYILLDPIFFWITIPIFSLLCGLVVWRSKSLTPSIIGHILFNLFQYIGALV